MTDETLVSQPGAHSFAINEADQEQFMLRHSAAVTASVQACEAHAPEVFARFGAAGRMACVEDIGHHLDFLRVTLETGELAPFVAYLGWLNDVLLARGIPSSSVPVSLEALARFFAADMRGEAGERIAAALMAGCTALRAGIATSDTGEGQPAIWEESEPYMAAALAGNRRGVQQCFDNALARSNSILQPELHVIQPALYGVGRAWQRNEVSVAQEHLATAISLTLMAQASANAECAAETAQRILLAGGAGNQHSVGLRMVADAFELAGWQTQYLGSNLPIPALVSQVRSFEPHVIGLSASLPQQLRALRATVRALRSQLGPACPLIAVGGQAFNRFPMLARSVDALFMGHHAGEAPALAVRALGTAAQPDRT